MVIDSPEAFKEEQVKIPQKPVAPASSPKTLGKSPGWVKGQKRRSKKRYPIAKKSYSRGKKSKKEVA